MAMHERDHPRQQVNCSFTTQARVGDYEGELTLTGETADDVLKAARLLSQAGIEPIRAASWHYTPDGLPICPKHGVAMRKWERQGDVWYAHNTGAEARELWCRGYPGKDSPGWETAEVFQ